jgi:hypothetical protein
VKYSHRSYLPLGLMAAASATQVTADPRCMLAEFRASFEAETVCIAPHLHEDLPNPGGRPIVAASGVIYVTTSASMNFAVITATTTNTT